MSDNNSDKENAARVAWALIKLSEMGTRRVGLAQVAGRVGLAEDEALRLLRLTWREKLAVRDDEIRLDAGPDPNSEGTRRFRVDADGSPVGSGKGCSVDMYLLALALGKPIHAEATCPTTGEPIVIDVSPDRVERIEPPTAVVAVTNLDFDITGGPDHTDAEMCSQQPFFASTEAAAAWKATHPDVRLIPVRDFHAEARRLVAWLEDTPSTSGRTT